MEDLISVIIPVYNLEKYLRESLDSVINQTYENLEIILVDDGSTDNSLRILREYEKKDKRISVLTQKNGGICMAMKNGVAFSSGKYIARCDGDDINELNRYERQLKYLKENDCDLVGCYLKAFGDGDENYQRIIDGTRSPIRNFNEAFSRAYFGGVITGGSIFGRSDVFKKLSPFHKDFGVIEDRLIYLSFFRNGYKIGMVEEILYNYRVHHTNTSLNPKNRLTMMMRHFELLFLYLFDEALSNYRNIIVVQRRDVLSVISKIFKERYGDLNLIVVDENESLRFFERGILNYKVSDTCVFLSPQIFNEGKVILESLQYEHLKNLFYLI